MVISYCPNGFHYTPIKESYMRSTVTPLLYFDVTTKTVVKRWNYCQLHCTLKTTVTVYISVLCVLLNIKEIYLVYTTFL